MFGLMTVKFHKEELELQSKNLWSHFNMWLNELHMCQSNLKICERQVELLKAKLSYEECKNKYPDIEPCVAGDELARMYIKGEISLESASSICKIKP